MVGIRLICWFVLLLFMMNPLSLWAQSDMDSLKQAALSQAKAKQYEAALEMVQEAMQEKAGNQQAVGKLHNLAGVIGYMQKEYEQALTEYEAYLAILEEETDVYEEIAKVQKNIALCWRKLGKDEKAESAYLSMVQAYEKLQDSSKRHSAYLSIANFYYYNQANHNQALEYAFQAKSIQSSPQVHALIGNCYKHKGFLQKALEYKQSVLQSYQQNDASDSKIAAALFDIAEIYQYKNDLDQAKSYYQSSLDLFLKVSKGKPSRSISILYRNMGRISELQKNYQQADQYFQQSLNIRKQLPNTSETQLASIYRVIGSNLLLQGKLQASQTYAQKALKVFEQDTESSNLATTYYLLGKIEFSKKKWAAAERYFQQSLDIFRVRKQAKDAAVLHEQLAQVHLQNRQEIQARSHIEEAYHFLVLDDELVRVKRDFQKVLHPYKLLKVLETKGEIWMQGEETPDKLKVVFESSLLAADLIAYIRQGFESEGSKENLGAQTLSIYERGIHAAWRLYQMTRDQSYKERAFDLSERSRAALLLEAVQAASAKQFSGIPSELLEREKSLKDEMLWYEKSMLELAEGSAKRLEFERELFTARIAYQALIDTFERQYPQYYDLRYNTQTLEVAELQSQLAPNTLLLEYFLGDSLIYVFAIGKEKFQMHELVKDSGFVSRIDEMRKGLYETSRIREPFLAYQQYHENAYWLYNNLLEPVLASADLSNEENTPGLLIVPAGAMGYIPFETLLRSPAPPDTPEYLDLSYLIKDYRIQYGYSATLLFRLKAQQERKAEHIYLGFAPSFDHIPDDDPLRLELPALHHTADEIQSIASMMPNQHIYIGMDATENQFKAVASSYRILHLATHGFANDAYPNLSRIAFTPNQDSTEDGFLHAYELYSMALNADLVVLSACNTGTGKLVQGEGIISLSRGFIYAGSPGILMTLWSVNDQTTQQLMQYFFEGLTAGLPKDEALRAARLRYLEEADPNLAHPYYWAAFVAIGDPAPISMEIPTESGGSWKWLLLGGIISFILIVFFIWYQKKSS